MARTITHIVGFASDAEIAEQLHELSHKNLVEHVLLQRQDTHRHRLRVRSNLDREYLVAIPRDQQLGDGAVLVLERDTALVVRMAEEHWLRLMPADIASAVELGYFAGNLHWRVRFDGPELQVALEGPEQDYLVRLQPFLQSGRAHRVDD